MKLIALTVALALGRGDPAPPRSYAGPTAVTSVVATAPVIAKPEAAKAKAPLAVAPSPPPPRVVAEHPSGLGGSRLAMQRVGVAAIVLGAAGYVAMIVGLGLGAAAESDLKPLGARDEIGRRRDLLARGTLANHLALGAGISAGILMATGIALVAVARRRGRRHPGTSRAASWR